MKTIVAAVSGGVDSVTMLDLLAKEHKGIVVAHFNHGIREDADEDERLTKCLAQEYSFKFESERGCLGPGTSETYARTRRYEFLFRIAQKHGGVIHTAHHADDVVETVALNLLRGTGWRGLVPLDDARMVRPLVNWWKTDIYNYATKNCLEWHEDSTNSQDHYLRNRVRRALQELTLQDKRRIFDLYKQQKVIKTQTDLIVSELCNIRSREFFKCADDDVALEVLRAICYRPGITPLKANLVMALNAIRAFKNGKKFELSKHITLKIGRDNFELM